MAMIRNITSMHSEIDERYYTVGGFVCFCVNFCTIFHWQRLRRHPVFPVLLSLCAANALKSAIYYVHGLQAIFLRYYHHTDRSSYDLGRDPARQWTHVWTFVGHQAVCWSTLTLAFDRFVATAYPEQYANTRRFYRTSVIASSWILTTIAWLSAFTYAKYDATGLNVWYELTIVRRRTPAVVGFYRCLNAAMSISCVVFVLSTIIVRIRRSNETRQHRAKWRAKVRVTTPSRQKLLSAPNLNKTPTRMRLLSATYPLRQMISSPRQTEGGVGGGCCWLIRDLTPITISLYCNGALWLLPAVVQFVRMASGDSLRLQPTTLTILCLLQSFHGCVDVLIYTLKTRRKSTNAIGQCCSTGSGQGTRSSIGGRDRPRQPSSISLMPRNPSITASYQACSSNAHTTGTYMEYTNVDDNTSFDN